MENTFLKEGKEMTYNEIIESFENMINKGIVENLDENQIRSLYVRLFEVVFKNLKEYLLHINYTVKTVRQGVLTVLELKLIEDSACLQKALKIYENIKENVGEVDGNDLKVFLCKDYYYLMKVLGQKVKLHKK